MEIQCEFVSVQWGDVGIAPYEPPGRVSEIPWRPRKGFRNPVETPEGFRNPMDIPEGFRNPMELKSSEAIDFFRHAGIIKAEKFIRCIMTRALGCMRAEGIR